MKCYYINASCSLGLQRCRGPTLAQHVCRGLQAAGAAQNDLPGTEVLHQEPEVILGSGL
jgi:hypothetical protein